MVLSCLDGEKKRKLISSFPNLVTRLQKEITREQADNVRWPSEGGKALRLWAFIRTRSTLEVFGLASSRLRSSC